MVLLAGGDITKRDDILWGYTIDDILPYVDYRRRDVRFREAILTFLGAGDEKEPQRRDQAPGEYCGGADIDECTAYFGEGVLTRVCETCPN